MNLELKKYKLFEERLSRSYIQSSGEEYCVQRYGEKGLKMGMKRSLQHSVNRTV